jgi:AcrR family transcriptional regulator
MAAITRTPRSRWIEEGLLALAAGGPDAVRVEVLAQALGVTKGGFYGHFADRNALLDEMLDSWERMSTDEVLERAERRGGDVRARLRRRARSLSPASCCRSTWPSATGPGVTRRSPSASGASTTGGWTTCGCCSARSAATRRRSRPRSVLAFSLVIGHHFLAADHGARSPADVPDLAASWLLA